MLPKEDQSLARLKTKIFCDTTHQKTIANALYVSLVSMSFEATA